MTNLATKAQSPVSMKDLMEAGVHFGHQTAKWNPKMKSYIHGARNGVYIINLQKTTVMFKSALDAVKRIASTGQKILFVGTKKQAQDSIREEATRAGQFYVTERWVGGTLTNFHTVKRSINVMKSLQKMAEEKNYGIRKKKEILMLEKKRKKLELYLTGIKDMVEVPGALFVIDPNIEYIAVNEARALGIPIFAIVDTNCDPDGIDYVIPGNDDSMRAIRLYAAAFSDAILDGLKTRESNLRSLGNQAAESKAAPSSTAGGPKVEVAGTETPVAKASETKE